MNTPLAIERRASSVDDLQATFAIIDAKRWEWASTQLLAGGMPVAAERAREFASEFRMLADRLSGAVAVGSAAE